MVDDKFWDFVNSNINTDTSRLRLKYHNDTSMGFDVSFAITQIECRRKFGKKLSETLSKFPHWLFADTLSGEQSTSDRLAQYHCSLISEGQSVIDLTSGLGIDVWHLSTQANEVTAVEMDAFKANVLHTNCTDNSLSNITTVKADCRDYIKHIDGHYDIAFIDPARRAEDGSRVYALSQCQPDVTAIMTSLAKVCDKLIIKMSPMLDITQTFRELPNAERIIALGTETECKELIAIVDLKNSESSHRIIEAVTLKNDNSETSIAFTVEGETQAEVISYTSTPIQNYWLYDPYPSVMKAAPYKLLSQRYGVQKAGNNTHLYFSRDLEADFPGQIFKIEEVIPYNSKYIKRLKKTYPKISISTRNFDESADKLKAKLGVADSDTLRLFAVTISDGSKQMLICKKAI